jgi:hypothetical protein
MEDGWSGSRYCPVQNFGISCAEPSRSPSTELIFLVESNDDIGTVFFGKICKRSEFGPRQREYCRHGGCKTDRMAAALQRLAEMLGEGSACNGWQAFHSLSARDLLSARSSLALWKEVQYYKRMYFEHFDRQRSWCVWVQAEAEIVPTVWTLRAIFKLFCFQRQMQTCSVWLKTSIRRRIPLFI